MAELQECESKASQWQNKARSAGAAAGLEGLKMSGASKKASGRLPSSPTTVPSRPSADRPALPLSCDAFYAHCMLCMIEGTCSPVRIGAPLSFFRVEVATCRHEMRAGRPGAPRQAVWLFPPRRRTRLKSRSQRPCAVRKGCWLPAWLMSMSARVTLCYHCVGAAAVLTDGRDGCALSVPH